MSETNEAQGTPVATEAAAPAPAGVVSAQPAAQAAPSSAIQQVEQEILTFFQQREQAIARLHAVEGAIQAGQHILAKLKAGEAVAVAEAKKLIGEAKPEVEKIEKAVETEVKKVEAAVEAEASKL
jgi:hypothetical protein